MQPPSCSFVVRGSACSRGSSVDAFQERVDGVPFVVEGLMSVEYDEIHRYLLSTIQTLAVHVDRADQVRGSGWAIVANSRA
jgi:hypothetical protein